MMKLILLLPLIFYCTSCSAQPISFPFSDKGWDQQIKGLLPKEWRSLDHVKLYETTLDEIEGFYGKGARFRKGDKNYSPYLQCYLVKSDQVVVFQSGPLGGWSTVTGILVAKKSAYGDESCGGSIDFEIPLSIYELKIGDDEGKIYDFLGQPSLKTKNLLAYRYEQKGESIVNGSGNRTVYITSGIEVGLKKGRVNWVRVYWQESI